MRKVLLQSTNLFRNSFLWDLLCVFSPDNNGSNCEGVDKDRMGMPCEKRLDTNRQ